MGFLKSAFDSVSRIHSKPGYLKRLGSPDLYTAIRTTPSNYFRYLAGPSQTVVPGTEVIVPVATIYGQRRLNVAVNVAPISGTFTFSFDLNGTTVTTGALDFDADQVDIQAALRLIAGCENVTVTGDLQALSFIVDFIGVKLIANAVLNVGSLLGVVVPSYTYSAIAWAAPFIKRGDKIQDASGNYTVTEVIEIPDLGGDIMGYRLRVE